MSRLTVAVVVPTIPGREQLLERALKSVHAQRRKADQIVVERDSMRTGAAQARNRGLERVTTDVIAWLDDDDELEPNHLIHGMRVMEHEPDVDLVYTIPRMIGGKDPTAVTYQGMFPTSPWGLRFTKEHEAHLRRHGSFIPITHFVRTEAVRRAGGFPEGRVLDTGRYQGEDERYLLALLDTGATFEHLAHKTWRWHVNPRSTAGMRDRN